MRKKHPKVNISQRHAVCLIKGAFDPDRLLSWLDWTLCVSAEAAVVLSVVVRLLVLTRSGSLSPSLL